MTPADELRTAAEKLRKLITAVPHEHWGDRPWHAEECSDSNMKCCPCIVAQGEYRDFDQPQIPPIQYIADAEGPELAAYIAAMHPGVGALLAKWLEETADEVEHAESSESILWDWCDTGSWHAARAMARAINGGQP